MIASRDPERDQGRAGRIRGWDIPNLEPDPQPHAWSGGRTVRSRYRTRRSIGAVATSAGLLVSSTGICAMIVLGTSPEANAQSVTTVTILATGQQGAPAALPVTTTPTTDPALSATPVPSTPDATVQTPDLPIVATTTRRATQTTTTQPATVPNPVTTTTAPTTAPTTQDPTPTPTPTPPETTTPAASPRS
jgi:hypothetical protein